jgi:glycosyltransferase involved in cell wall biosynthesis
VNLLILTQYFPPEIGAPQNRLFELALRLQKNGLEITVFTAMPNYPQMKIYEGYENKKYLFEVIEGIKVHRSSIFIPTKKSVISRLRNYFSFVLSSASYGKKKLGDFDFLMCESPPLFLGYSAMYLARKKNAKLIFNVSDLWPESAEKLGVVTNKFLLKLAYRLEKKLYKKATLVTGQTQGICKNIKERFPQVKTYWLPNGVDLNYYNPNCVSSKNWRLENGFTTTDFILIYAGIIGIAQGLEIILTAAKLLENKKEIKFLLMGSGPEKEKLLLLKRTLNLHNVLFFDAVAKKQMPGILKEMNAAIIPLRKLDLFLGAIPSKIFENLAMEVPILLGVDGEAKELFIDKGKCGLFFKPEDAQSLHDQILQLYNNAALHNLLGKNGRDFVTKHFNRQTIAENFKMQLVEANNL